MTGSLLWPWLVETYGLWGALLFSLLAILLVISWGVVPLGLWLLYRKGRILAQQVDELMLFKGEVSRQQQVERLRRDKERTETLQRQPAEPLHHDAPVPQRGDRQQKAERSRRGRERTRRKR